jgi:hypothetical protein
VWLRFLELAGPAISEAIEQPLKQLLLPFLLRQWLQHYHRQSGQSVPQPMPLRHQALLGQLQVHRQPLLKPALMLLLPWPQKKLLVRLLW